MRLPPHQIKQGILHPKQDVRDVCAYYFANAFSPDPDIMPLVIQAIESRGWEDAFGMYSFLGNLVQTEETVRWAIDQLEQRHDNEEEASLTSWLLDALNNAAPALIQTHKERIMALEVLDAWEREAIEERILLHGCNADKLWQEFEQFGEDFKHEDYLTDEDTAYAHRLVESMGVHPSVFNDKTLDLLAQEIDDYTDHPMKWMEPCLVRLAGELRLQQAVPLLIKKLHEDDETLNPDCVRSLVKIGGDEVVDAVADGFREAEWGFRLTASGLFEKIHTDRSVGHALELLHWEEKLVIRCRLAQSALMNFAEEAIEPARQLVLNTDLDPEVIEVRNDLLVAAELLGVELPEREQWEEDAQHDIEFRKKWYAEHFPGGADEEEEPFDDDFPGDDEELLPPMDTVVREEPKVGRNAPCPCGSGKKFKKCCMRKQRDGDLFD